MFDREIAAAYDSIYSGKKYMMECDILISLFRKYALTKSAPILDMGCGTGNHTIPLAMTGYNMTGYNITGVDRSPSMLAIASSKVWKLGLTIPSHCGDIRTIRLDKTFDAVIMMFSVMNYQIEDGDVMKALETAHIHLKDGGLLIFDFWYGPAVLAQKPSTRETIIKRPYGTILKTSRGILLEKPLCYINLKIQKMNGDRIMAEITENHILRYFFDDEIKDALDKACLEIREFVAFPNVGEAPDPGSWNAMIVAQKG